MTDGIWRKVGRGSGINVWAMTEPEVVSWPGVARPMPDRVDYRFTNGSVDTGVFPCREALMVAVAAGREVRMPEGPFTRATPGGESPDVDFSRFCHAPTLIRRGFRCAVRAAEAGVAEFEVATCGSVTVWADGREVLRFEPFTRNVAGRTVMALAVGPEPVEITVALEDLHERDTTCFFAMIPRSGPALETRAPGLDGGRIEEAARALASLRTDRVFYESGDISVVCDEPPGFDLPFRLVAHGQFMRGGIAGPHRVRETVGFRVGPGKAGAVLMRVASSEQGCVELVFEAEVDGVRLERGIGTSVVPPATPLAGADVAARKVAAADRMAARGSFEPATALLLMSRGEKPALAAEIVDRALDDIERRFDCADFSILPLLRIWRDNREGLEPARRARLRAALLGFRYWLDEPGNDVMWFWSENHVLCFHVAQLAAGTFFADEVFSNSGKTGAVLAAEATERIGRWFDSIEAHGLAEWNSAAYYPIDMLALFSLHDLAEDARLVERSAALLDMIFVMTGLHTTGGVPAGSQGRAYEKELLAGPATELGSVAAIAFGGRWPEGYDRAAALFCLSDYMPPDAAARFAKLRPGEVLEARYTQGLEHAGRLTLWKTPDVQISTVSDHHAGERGKQQHVIDVQFAGHPMARAWINHPGELKVWGERRPSLLAGNAILPRVAQVADTAFIIHDLTSDLSTIGFTQLFAPRDAFDLVEAYGNWLFLRSGNGCAGIWCSDRLAPMTGGLYRDAIWRGTERVTGWVVVGGSVSAEADFAAFRAGLTASEVGFNADALVLSARLPSGAYALRHDGPLSRDGSELVFGPLNSTPHASINGGPMRPWTDRA